MKKRAKILLCIVSTILVLVVISFVVENSCLCINSRYMIFERNGKTYMQLFRNMIHWNPEYCELGKYSAPVFASLPEMKRLLLSGQIADDLLGGLQKYEKEKLFEICDLNELYTVQLPDGLDVSNVKLDRINYYVYFEAADGASGEYITEKTNGYIAVLDEEYYSVKQEEILQNRTAGDFTVVMEREINERNASETYYKDLYKNQSNEYHEIDVNYQIATADGYVDVIEHYLVDWTFYTDGAQLEPTAERVLQSVEIYGASANQNFYGIIHNLDKSPSLEWLSSFGLQEFT